MLPAARLQAAIELVDLIAESARDNGPAADSLISQWFRDRRYAGSKDRRAVRDLVYRAIRRFAHVPPSGRAAFAGFEDLRALFDGSHHGPETLHPDEKGMPPSLVPDWLDHDIPQAEHEKLLERAPLDLRVNTLKTSRAAVQALLPEAVPIAGIDDGLRLSENITLANRPELAGLVEVQDAGSQMIAIACAAMPGQTVLDFCAGAGGKTLALAAHMKGQGRLIASDTDRSRLSRLGPRAAIAGAQGIETRLINPNKEVEGLSDLVGSDLVGPDSKGLADCVLVDAPCSGTGTWRRNPELRWRLTPDRLAKTRETQARLLDVAAQFVRPGGALVYAVCSILSAEGAEQIDQFLVRNKGFTAGDTGINLGRASGAGRLLTPAHDETDGFFVARLQKAC
jgi:16S rRNA (cytosine967-C5)-methyltransferase